MTDKRQPDALHLADIADDGAWTFVIEVRKEIAVELRRQYAEIETLRTGYEAARLEIESLKAQLKEHADELTVAYMCGASREKELAALQTGAAYASLPDMDDTLWLAIGQHRRAITTVETSAAAKAVDAAVRKLLRDYADATHTLRVESLAAAYCEELDKLSQRNYELRLASLGQAPAQAAPAAVAGPSLYQVMAVAKAIHATTPDADDWDSLRQCEVDVLRGRAEKVLAALAATPTTQPAPAAVAEPWSLGEFEGNWRDIDHKNHQGVIRIVWKMEDDERTLDCEALALAVVDALNAAAPTAQPAPQQEAPADELEEVLRERDDAEDFINELLDEVLGADRPEWSSAYNRYDAMSDVRERITALHKPAVDKALDLFESAMAAPQPSPAAQGDALESEYQRGYRQGYEQRDAEVRGALV
ncbi:hypothetical protein [Simplicispira piscis]